MRRMNSVAPRPWLAVCLALALAAPEAALAQAEAGGLAAEAGLQAGGSGPAPAAEGGFAGGLGQRAPGSGPMTWGGVLSRSLVHPPGSGSAELVQGGGDPAAHAADGEILPQGPVVELFTSQGCAACPAADALFETIAARDDVIALALHVDYWDYIGWADAFARPEHTKRQKAYARAAGSKVIYTPQIIVAGQHPAPANDPAGIDALVAAAAGPGLLVLRSRGGDARRTVTAMAPHATGELVVQIVRYRPRETVTIERGENAGRTITYRNIVTGWNVLGQWDGRDRLVLDLTLEGPDPAVLLFQRAGYGRILAAARLP